jgi:UDP-N-acetyl-D-galactosamine dehydrogenase
MKNIKPLSNVNIAVVGLGYVGLPLLVEIGKARSSSKYQNTKVVGFDINRERIIELKLHTDTTCEVPALDLIEANIQLTSDPSDLSDCDVFIITVPTPITAENLPDLSPLESACRSIGNLISSKKSSQITSDYQRVIIFESTVYPGLTEEVCIPLIESESGLSLNKDFVCGYSPERINPGDKQRKLTDITKVTSGSTPQSAEWIDQFYQSFVKAGTHKAPSIRVAEAAKIIENTQRDINIALMNELCQLFKLLDIDVRDVLEAASTKWNFHNYTPGLVGGHCIGVDPYYLTFKAAQVGYKPEMILSGRRINDSMAFYVADTVAQEMNNRDISWAQSKVLILGFTFKENCPDTRNTKVLDLASRLCFFNMNVDVYDPLVVTNLFPHSDIKCISEPLSLSYDVIVLAVAHQDFQDWEIDKWKTISHSKTLFVDLKNILPSELNPVRF